MKRLFVILFVGFSLIYCRTGFAGDVEAVLNSNDGSTNFEVKDSASVVQMQVDSDGNVVIKGSVGIGPGDLFRVDSNGNLIKVNNVTYSWPAGQGAASSFLRNNGSGALAWETPFANQGTATTVLHGNAGGNPSFGTVVESDITLTDNTTNDVSVTDHGFAPKTPGNTTTFLRGDATWADPDPWTYVVLASDFTTTSNVAVDVTGMFFTPSANTQYEIRGMFMLRTATTTVGPRPGCAWPTGMTDGVATFSVTSSATAQVLANGNINAAVLSPIGGLPIIARSYPSQMDAILVAGASPSGNFRIQFASEASGTTVTMKAGSFIKYRSY